MLSASRELPPSPPNKRMRAPTVGSGRRLRRCVGIPRPLLPRRPPGAAQAAAVRGVPRGRAVVPAGAGAVQGARETGDQSGAAASSRTTSLAAHLPPVTHPTTWPAVHGVGTATKVRTWHPHEPSIPPACQQPSSPPVHSAVAARLHKAVKVGGAVGGHLAPGSQGIVVGVGAARQLERLGAEVGGGGQAEGPGGQAGAGRDAAARARGRACAAGRAEAGAYDGGGRLEQPASVGRGRTWRCPPRPRARQQAAKAGRAEARRRQAAAHAGAVRERDCMDGRRR
jgi:hypothetical protein